ncbi:hypothetical protein BpHYR1_000488 [Brachionus plicatilis]|uniref:Uncharacterized protein n=1 Tax=Brachionus plicatilis TaxID=10195 RepID=A0A3M7SWE6_BRAPC|nr:hypothetical protein BpHYR1_000488 [Brachionus plicatilis]
MIKLKKNNLFTDNFEKFEKHKNQIEVQLIQNKCCFYQYSIYPSKYKYFFNFLFFFMFNNFCSKLRHRFLDVFKGCSMKMVEFYSVNKKEFRMEPKMSSTMKQQASKFAKKDYFHNQFDNCDGYHRTCQIRNRAFSEQHTMKNVLKSFL